MLQKKYRVVRHERSFENTLWLIQSTRLGLFWSYVIGTYSISLEEANLKLATLNRSGREESYVVEPA
jgi:hypothetical protein